LSFGRARTDSSTRAAGPTGLLGRHPGSKVPEVMAVFWVIKVLSTAMGESTSDYLVHRISPVAAVLIGGIGFTVAMVLQLSVRRYLTWIYWLAVVMVSVFGTMAADVLHIQFRVPYTVSTLFFAAALAVIFTLWYAIERSLSIHSIYTGRQW